MDAGDPAQLAPPFPIVRFWVVPADENYAADERFVPFDGVDHLILETQGMGAFPLVVGLYQCSQTSRLRRLLIRVYPGVKATREVVLAGEIDAPPPGFR